jgi:hypothetical protein
MTDDNNDPWRSLADELGVQPGQEGSTPPPPSVPNPPTSRQRSQPPHSAPPHSAPPKKSKSDWNALAGELGLEASADSETPESDHDPVAELLGFPSPGSFPAPRDEGEARRQRDDYDEEHGEESDRSANRDRWRDEDDQQRRSNMYDDTRPVYDDAEQAESNERGEGPSRDSGSADQPREYRPRRRGGRGRGRSRGGDRPREVRGDSRYGNENRERRSHDDQRSGEQEPQGERRYADESGEGQSTSDEARPEGASRDQERSSDEQSQRRRRGRRGRGRGRERSDRRPSYGERAESSRPGGEEPSIENLSEDLFDSADVSEIDFASTDFSASAEVFGSEHDLHDDPLDHELAPSHAAEGAEHDDEAGLSDADDNGNGRSSVRDIITWKEAIGMIIDGNMQSRAESPQSQQHSRPSRGRGRGRGGRGGRGGQRH